MLWSSLLIALSFLAFMKLLLFTVSVPAVAYLHFHCNCHTSIFLHMYVKFRRILFTSLEFLRPGLAPVPAKHFLLQPRLCDQALLSNTFFKRFYINKNELDGKVVDINQPVELWREQTLLSGDRHVYLVQPVEGKHAACQHWFFSAFNTSVAKGSLKNFSYFRKMCQWTLSVISIGRIDSFGR